MDGSLSSEPAGTTISRPLRVWCGNGDPHTRQKVVAKLLAVGRSKRTTWSIPDVHRKQSGVA
jgi:hypothetical protein